MGDGEQTSNIQTVSDMIKYLTNRQKTWQNIEINFAVIGDSGTGKSSFINAVRGIDDDDEKAAQVGIIEDTVKPQSFLHPTHPKIRFWDLPTIGSPRFHNDLELYCDEVNFSKYDAFLIFSYTRFTQNNFKLANKVNALGKKFLFIRSKIDATIEGEKRKKSFNEEAMTQEIRQDCLQSLGNLISDERDIFLISNHFPSKWDFQRLKQAIVTKLPIFQRQSLRSSLRNESRQFMRQNISVFHSWIWKISAGAFIGGLAFQFPCSLAIDISLIFVMLRFLHSKIGNAGNGSLSRLRASPRSYGMTALVLLLTKCIPPFARSLYVGASSPVPADISKLSLFSYFLAPTDIFSVAAGVISYITTHKLLTFYVGKLEKKGMEVLDETLE